MNNTLNFKCKRPRGRITYETACNIKYLYNVKKMYQHHIAALYGINQGRISEIMNGKRFPGAPTPTEPVPGAPIPSAPAVMRIAV